MFPFRGVDYMDIDSLFSEQERLVRQTTRQFVEDRVIPIIERHNREATFPLHLVRELAELGFFGANLSGYGCAGMSNVEYGLIMQELERGDSGLRSFCSVQGALVMYPILTFGTEEQKQHWLPRLQNGTALGCFGLTEPDFGSNPAGMRAVAVRDGSSFILNGEKTWITNGSVADVAVVWARLDGVIRGFLVEKGTPGFKTSDIHGKWSLRASITSSLSFQDCRIPEENLLPGARGLKSPLSCLTQARYGIGWGAVGAAMACYDTARQYTILRKQFHDRPIASHQLVQNELAWMITEITKAQLMALHVGRLKDAGKADFSHISMLKRNNVWMALETARRSRDLLGANGITDEYPIFRHMCNLETVKTYEGTHNIHTLIIGEKVTGVSAYV
ncbi:MAG: acyl-CoA dehydrogenase family protein [Acidobacteria bacterium]|nr:acyl-CoA dehydrogenase family protein [Acidobacteriota bacterium]